MLSTFSDAPACLREKMRAGAVVVAFALVVAVAVPLALVVTVAVDIAVAVAAADIPTTEFPTTRDICNKRTRRWFSVRKKNCLIHQSKNVEHSGLSNKMESDKSFNSREAIVMLHTSWMFFLYE